MHSLNPYRPSTVAVENTARHEDEPDRFSLQKRLIWSFIYFYPPLAWLGFHSSWLAAWYSLGHIPRPSIDDPASISTLVNVCRLVSLVCLLTLPLGTILGFFAIFWSPFRFRIRPALQILVLLLCYLTLVGIIGLTIEFDPGRSIEWFLD